MLFLCDVWSYRYSLTVCISFYRLRPTQLSRVFCREFLVKKKNKWSILWFLPIPKGEETLTLWLLSKIPHSAIRPAYLSPFGHSTSLSISIRPGWELKDPTHPLESSEGSARPCVSSTLWGHQAYPPAGSCLGEDSSGTSPSTQGRCGRAEHREKPCSEPTLRI